MDRQAYKCLLIADYNANNLAGFLNNDNELPNVRTTVAPFGQVIPTLVEESLDYWQTKPDFAVIWTQPQSVIKSFNDVLNYQKVTLDKILNEVDEYSSIVLNIQARVNFAFVPTWVCPTYHKGFGMLDMKNGIGIANVLMRMNLRLSENLDNASNIYLFDAQKWTEAAGVRAFNPKLWYMAKIPFGNEVFKEAVKDLKSSLKAIAGQARKLVIVDLDDTLWGGIVGDIGWQDIRVGGHDHIGEAFADFQVALKSLTNRGVVLGIVSKNEETIALEAINNHPEMVLREKDFVGWRINWNDKAQNIVDLVSELNLGLQSVVFIDDNPIERARVREALPEVLVPEWPEDKMLYKNALLNLRCFDTYSITDEDMQRTRMYATERQREKLKGKVASLDEWLKTLDIRIEVEELNKTNLQRTVQLLNKTNQMNLSTRRMSESELVEWVGQGNHKLWVFRVSDKFGDSGLTGITSLEIKDKKGEVVDFVLSCRVIARKVEEAMLYAVITYARSIELDEVYAIYIRTAKNKPCLEFWKRSGFAFNQKQNRFTRSVADEYPLPDCVQIKYQENLSDSLKQYVCRA